MTENKRIKFSICLLVSILFVFSAPLALAASKVEINAKVKTCLQNFYKKVPEAKELEKKSNGLLVFPSVIKAGFGIGGEYGEGALIIDGQTVDYYSTAAGSIGFQLGAQSKSVILMFIQKKALTEFRDSKGWKVGVDGSVALIELGAGKSIDTTNIKDPVIGFIFGQKGLMYNLTLEGSKFTKLKK